MVIDQNTTILAYYYHTIISVCIAVFFVGQNDFRNRGGYNIDVRHADGSLERKSVGEAVDALKRVVKYVICSVNIVNGMQTATWSRDSVCRDLAIDKAVQLQIINFSLAGII